MMTRERTAAFFSRCLVLAGLYFLAARLGLFLATVHQNSSPVWPASGLAVGCLFVFGYRFWPAIYLGAFLANWFAPTSFLPSMGIAVGNTLEGLLGAWILSRVLPENDSDEGQRSVLAYPAAGAVSSLVSAGIGVGVLLLSSKLDLSRAFQVGLTWWTGDTLGILVVTPLLVAVTRFKKFANPWSPRKTAEAALISCAVLAALMAIFNSKNGVFLIFLVNPMLLLIAARLGSFPVKVMAMVVSIFGIWSTFHGGGPFRLASTNDNLVVLQLFLGSVALTSLALATFRRPGSLKFPGVAMLFAWTMTAMVFVFFVRSEARRDFERFEKLTDAASQALSNRMDLYEDGLRGGVSLFSASRSVEVWEWKDYIDSYRLLERRPGISGMGVIFLVSPKNREKFEKMIRYNRIRDFKIHSVPSSLGTSAPSHSEQYVITFIEPYVANQAAVGLDVASEPGRRSAAEFSRDTGQIAITPIIQLVQDPLKRAGFLLFLPIYKSQTLPQTTEERRRHLIGWVYSPFVAEEYFSTALAPLSDELQVVILDGTERSLEHLAYRSEGVDFDHFSAEKTTTLRLANRQFSMHWKRAPGFVSAHDSTGAWISALGALLSVLVGALVSGIQSLQNRAERIANEKTRLLSASENRFRNLVQLVPAGTFQTSPEGNYLFVSESWCKIAGLTSEKALDKGWLQAIHPEDRDFVFMEWYRTVRERRAFDLEYRFVRSNQQILWIHVHADALVDVDGNTIGYLGQIQDITSRKEHALEIERLNFALEARVRERTEELEQAVRSLRRSEESFRRLSDSVPQIVWTTGADGANEYFNQRWWDYTGMDPDEKYERSKGLELLHPDDRQTVQAAWEKAYQDSKLFEIEYRLRRHDGAYRWHLGRVVPELDSDGKFVRGYGTATDIDDQKRATEAAKEAERSIAISELRFRSIVENSPFPTQLLSPTGSTTKVNRAWKKLWEVPEEVVTNFIYKSYNIFEDPLMKSLGLMPLLQDAFAGKDVSSGTYLYDPATVGYPGRSRWVEAYFSPICNPDGSLSEVVLMFNDITEKKSASEEKVAILGREQAALETSRLKSEFLANMSHEIRTPINGIVGMTRLLSDTALNSEQREYADGIGLSADSLLAVINDILDFSKIEANKLDFESLDFDLMKVIQDVEKTMNLIARKKGLRLIFEIEEKLPRFVKGDPGRLTQVFNNLVSNAIKFTPKGRVTLRAQFMAVENGLNHLRFEIQDTGIGIPEKALSKMFQAFSQADATMARRFGGSGLGLSICKYLVQMMGGDIGVESYEGVGSTFWFEVRLSNGVERVTSSSDKSIINVAERLGRPARILLVEDNPVNQKIGLKLLEKMGLRADAAGNGKEALDALRGLPYDLILMDCQMPEMDGYEATRIIRSDGSLPDNAIPVIAMTANAIKGDREKCLEAGMNDYLSKPVQVEELAEVLLKWLLSRPQSSKIKSE